MCKHFNEFDFVFYLVYIKHDEIYHLNILFFEEHCGKTWHAITSFADLSETTSWYLAQCSFGFPFHATTYHSSAMVICVGLV